MKIFNFTFYFFLISTSIVYGAGLKSNYTSSECFWAGMTEAIGPMFGAPPGLGYVFTGQYDKALLLGGTRLIAARQYQQAIKTESYQKEADDVYQTTKAEDSASGKEETNVYMNKSTWNAGFYGNLYSNLTYLSFWDLYEHDCQPNVDTYKTVLAPFNFGHFYKKWQFWLPMLALAYNYSNFNYSNKVNWYLGNGLTKSQLTNEGTLMYYTVGIGEEALFRGTIQKSLYNYLKSWDFSASTSRHSAVFLSSALFGAAHSGKGFSANSFYAFLFGLYQGYVYQPDIEEFDLMTAIAIHSWWDIIVFYTILNHGDVIESSEPVQIPLMNISFQF